MRITDSMLRNLQTISAGDLELVNCKKVQKMQPDLSQSDLNKLQHEKLKLKAVVADLTQVNRRWQRYNGDLQIYIKKLQATIDDQQEQLNNMADKQAQKIFHPNSEREHQGTYCNKCQPIIEFMNERITLLEESLGTSHERGCHKLTDPSTEIHSLQLRLRQACQHIDHLNKLLLNKGVLKSGYNFLPETPNIRVIPCSRDGLEFYECDGNLPDPADLNLTTSSTGTYFPKNDVKASTFEPDPSTSKQDIESNESFDTCLKDHLISCVENKFFLDMSDDNLSDRTDFIEKTCKTTRNFDQCSQNSNKNHASTCRTSDNVLKRNGSDDVYNVKMSPDRLNSDLLKVKDQTSSLDISSDPKTSDLDQETKSKPSLDSDIGYDSLTDNTISFVNPPVSPARSSDSKYASTDNISSLTPDNVTGILSSPLICPHCFAIFPPDSNDFFSLHKTSCQLL